MTRHRPRLAPPALLLALALSAGCGGGSSDPSTLVVDIVYGPTVAYRWHPATLRPTVTGLGGHSATYTLQSGTLPAGLTFDTRTGVISGTPTEAWSGMLTVVLTVPGMEGSVQVSQEFAVAGPAVEHPAIWGAQTWVTDRVYAPVAYVNSPLTGAAPWAPAAGESLTYEVLTGTLPAGVTLDPATGILDGTPTSLGTATFTVRATVTRPGGTFTFDSGNTTLDIRNPMTVSYPWSTVARAYDTVAVTPYIGSYSGWTGVTYRFAVEGWGGYAAALPAALQLDPDTGVIAGVLMPTTPGALPTGIKVTVTHGGLSYDMRTQAGFYATP